jgi:hypothetical protein
MCCELLKKSSLSRHTMSSAILVHQQESDVAHHDEGKQMLLLLQQLHRTMSPAPVFFSPLPAQSCVIPSKKGLSSFNQPLIHRQCC